MATVVETQKVEMEALIAEQRVEMEALRAEQRVDMEALRARHSADNVEMEGLRVFCCADEPKEPNDQESEGESEEEPEEEPEEDPEDPEDPELRNLCLECGVDMGPGNPRQLCGKWCCQNIFTPPKRQKTS